MLSMTQALRRIKGQLEPTVPQALVQHICDDLGLRYRRRTLTPVVTT